jgi:hypothetical protein
MRSWPYRTRSILTCPRQHPATRPTILPRHPLSKVIEKPIVCSMVAMALTPYICWHATRRGTDAVARPRRQREAPTTAAFAPARAGRLELGRAIEGGEARAEAARPAGRFFSRHQRPIAPPSSRARQRAGSTPRHGPRCGRQGHALSMRGTPAVTWRRATRSPASRAWLWGLLWRRRS